MNIMQSVRCGFCWIALVVVLVLFSVSAWAGPFIEIGIGRNAINDQDWWIGRDSAGAALSVGYVWRIKNYQISAQWDHFSQWTRGEPFSDRDEHSLDSVYIKLRKEWE